MKDPERQARLGRNQGGYRGETIDIDRVNAAIGAAARQFGWREETFHEGADWALRAYVRPGRTEEARRVYLSAGIHGDEPAGPLAVLELMRRNAWPGDVALWVCPCLNPTGFRMGRRENAEGLDLNRQYLHRLAAETQSHISWVDRQPAFALALCLHEDWESAGFYVYELNPENRPSLAESMVAGVAAVCPVDESPVIDGREACRGIIRPNVDPLTRPEWPEAFYLLQAKTRLSYTLEAPSDFCLATRVAALVVGVERALGQG